MSRPRPKVTVRQPLEVLDPDSLDDNVQSIFYKLAFIDADTLPILVEELRRHGISFPGDELDSLSSLPIDPSYRLTLEDMRNMLHTGVSEKSRSIYFSLLDLVVTDIPRT